MWEFISAHWGGLVLREGKLCAESFESQCPDRGNYVKDLVEKGIEIKSMFYFYNKINQGIHVQFMSKHG